MNARSYRETVGMGPDSASLSPGVPIAIRLQRGSIFSVRLEPGESRWLYAHSGSGWITMEYDSVDYLLQPSCPLAFTGPGKLVVEAVGETDLRFVLHAAR